MRQSLIRLPAIGFSLSLLFGFAACETTAPDRHTDQFDYLGRTTP